MPADGPPDLGDDAFLPSKPRAPAISRSRGVGGPDFGKDPFPRSVNNTTGSPAKLPGAGDEDDMMRKMGFGSFATGRFVKKMGKDGLQKSIDAAEVDLTQVRTGALVDCCELRLICFKSPFTYSFFFRFRCTTRSNARLATKRN